jgi:hypothetical protein
MTEPGFFIKSFLFLNWERPLTWPELGVGLSSLGNAQILEILDGIMESPNRPGDNARTIRFAVGRQLLCSVHSSVC